MILSIKILTKINGKYRETSTLEKVDVEDYVEISGLVRDFLTGDISRVDITMRRG